jgi:cyclophilin family peptidyl-prolyl cis-trans isomerase
VVQNVELLEERRLLSATVVSQIPTQTIGAGSAPSITLGNYLKDTQLTGGTIVEMQTPLGNIPLQLTNSQTPLTVANFLTYITNGEYTPTIIQRSAPGFVLQGGGTKPDGSNNASVASLQGEPGISNTTGTIAMALSSGPNSGTNQWFINLANNSQYLDGTNDGGPFTVFGNVIDNGMTVATAISQLPIIDGSAENQNWYLGSPQDGLPVINYTGVFSPTTVPQANLVTDNIVQVPASQAVTYTVSSANSNLVTGSIANGVLNLSRASASASGSTTMTVTARDLSGTTVSSTFTVNVQGIAVVSAASASGTASATVGSGGQTAQISFPVTLSTANSSATTLSYTVTAGSAPSGDFQTTGSSVTIPAGSTQATIPVTILHDSTGGNETFTLTLSALSGNAVFSNGSSTLSVTGTIKPAAVAVTTAAITASAASVAFGGAVTFTATVTPAVAGAAATGSVVFSAGGTVLGSAPVVDNSATLAVNLNQTGAVSVTAAYSGDASNLSATSAAVVVTVADPSTLSASITKAVVPATAIAGQAYKAAVSLGVSNSDGIAPQTGVVRVNLYATLGGVITPDSVVIGSATRKATYANTKAVPVSIAVKSLPGTLAAGVYTLVAQSVDTAGTLSAPVAGPTVTVAAPTIALSETFARLILPGSVVAGSKTSAAAVVKIVNNGNVISTGTTQINLFASPDGTIASGKLIKSISKKLSIRANQSATVSIPLGAYPLVTDGNYSIIAQVIDPKSQATSVTSSGTVNIAAARIDLAASRLVVPASGKIGKSISVTLSLGNLGNELAAGKLQIAFAFSSSSTGANPFAAATLQSAIKLPAGKTQILHLKVPVAAGTPAGAVYAIATLDPANLFGDVNLANNTVISSSAITLG